MTDPLIRTKLCLPFTRQELVPRCQLQERIAQGLQGPLTLVIAPAGFGKTTLVASCFTDSGFPIAWLSLDKDDNRDGRFLNYLIAALQQADPTIGSEAAQLLTASRQLPPELVLTSLINELDEGTQEIALVLDDYHVINSQSAHTAVTFLLEHCPQTLHLVIMSRSDPPLPLTRLRARGQLTELRAADLSFTEAEAAQFLNDVMGLHLGAPSIARLAERTEGWIAGLQMAALSMRDHKDTHRFIESFSGTNRHILDYLLEEVLARETEEIQTFLLQTAILTRLTGPLCDAVTGGSDSQKMLERLEKSSLFVMPLDDERRWYRYHHLFADLLQARLHQSGPERVAQLFSRAAAWCALNGQIAEAISYALAAKDFDQAAGLIAQQWGQATSEGEIETVWSWLKALPENTIKNSAPLSLAYCWLLWFRGEIETIATHLMVAEHIMSKLNVPEPELSAQLAALRAFVARYQGEFETAIACGKQALTLLPEDLPPSINAQLRSMVFLAMATAYDGAGDLEQAVGAYTETIRWSRVGTSAAGVTGITYRLVGALRLLGRLREANEACREALAFIEAKGMTRLPAAGILHLALSEVLVEQNDLAAAETHLAQGIELGKWSGRLDAAKNAVHAQARLKLAFDDVDGALTAVQEAITALSQPPSPLAKAELLALKAKVLLRQGATTEAAQCAKEAVYLAGNDQGQTGQMTALAACRVQLAQSKPEEAITRLTQSIVTAEENGRLGLALELYILRSLALARHGNRQKAAADLEGALILAAPEGYVRIFLDEGQPMQMLLAQWLAQANRGHLRDYASHLLSQFETFSEKDGLTGDPVEPLSPRELEVLQIMAVGKTNKQIAQQLVVAKGTVKAHTANIYRKLDVANRTEAVARARELGLLP